MQFQIQTEYLPIKNELLSIPERFDTEGETIYVGRNTLKVFEIGNEKFCVKSFQIPHVVNRFAYAYIRKSKAERSFLYASRFLSMGINTPAPVAFMVYRNLWGVNRSYYIYKWQPCDCTFRGIATSFPDEKDEVYKAFARFTYDFHSKGVYFIDYSAGNTLVRKEEDGSWHFWLIDLNRTNFVEVPPRLGIKNLARLELPEASLRVIAGEYARLRGEDPEEMSRLLIELTGKNNDRVVRKSHLRAFRKKIKGIFSRS